MLLVVKQINLFGGDFIMQTGITLTAAAQQFLLDNLATSPAGTIGIRVGLRDAGCSGFAYTVDFTDVQNPDDQSFDLQGVKILIAEKDYAALKGTEIDLVQEGVNAELEFNNPNVIHECGCGESFQVKES